MKKGILSIGLALAMVMAISAPAFADDSTHSASVTVDSFVAVTITDTSGGGIKYGTVDPDGNDNAETDMSDGTGSVVVTVELESNTTILTGVKNQFANYGNDVATTGSGVATGGDSTTVLVDSTADFVTNGVAVGDYVYNTTDGSWTTVTTVTDLNTLTCAALTGGTDGNFQSGDAFRVSDDATQFVIANGKWDDNWAGSTKTPMTTSFAQVASTGVSGSDVDVDIYLWLAVPAQTAADTYYTDYVIKAIDQATGL